MRRQPNHVKNLTSISTFLLSLAYLISLRSGRIRNSQVFFDVVDFEAIGCPAAQSNSRALGCPAVQSNSQALGCPAVQSNSQALGCPAVQSNSQALGCPAVQSNSQALGCPAVQALAQTAQLVTCIKPEIATRRHLLALLQSYRGYYWRLLYYWRLPIVYDSGMRIRCRRVNAY